MTRRGSAFPLQHMTDRLSARPVASLAEAARLLPEDGDLWGFFTAPAEAHLGRLSAAEWRAVLADPRLTEARIVDEVWVLHWLGGRGVYLKAGGEDAAEDLVAGEGWLQRERRSRLWGEWLAEAGGWYEERIPDPLRYTGLPQGPESRFAFLVYREYIFRGAVCHVRYLRLEGASS
ncbi:MAG: hypothetical protein ACRD2T_06695 [Thermoanaerobaculia bacterium]